MYLALKSRNGPWQFTSFAAHDQILEVRFQFACREDQNFVIRPTMLICVNDIDIGGINWSHEVGIYTNLKR
jgi:hypothetical protein